MRMAELVHRPSTDVQNEGKTPDPALSTWPSIDFRDGAITHRLFPRPPLLRGHLNAHVAHVDQVTNIMMSLVSTPVTLARVTAPKKARTQTVAKASVADAAKSSAVAGALALTIMAQPALAMTEIGQIADKASDAKAIAAAEYAELLNKKAAGKATAPGPTKTKNLAVGLPSLSLPSFSAPSVGGGSKAAPKEAPKANQGSVKDEVRRQLLLTTDRKRLSSKHEAIPIKATSIDRVFFRLAFSDRLPNSPARATAERFASFPRAPELVQNLRLIRRAVVSNRTPFLSSQTRFHTQGEGFLGVAMLALFSPLAVVAVFSVQTLLRVIPQAAEGKEFFPKDTMPF